VKQGAYATKTDPVIQRKRQREKRLYLFVGLLVALFWMLVLFEEDEEDEEEEEDEDWEVCFFFHWFLVTSFADGIPCCAVWLLVFLVKGVGYSFFFFGCLLRLLWMGDLV